MNIQKKIVASQQRKKLWYLKPKEQWEEEFHHSYDAKVLEREFEERLYSEEGKKILGLDTEK